MAPNADNPRLDLPLHLLRLRRCDHVRHRQPAPPVDARDERRLPDHSAVLGPLALAFYWRWGRASTQSPAARAKTAWVGMAMEVSHCGSGCVLGDLVAEWTIFGAALTISGYALFAEYVGDYILALAFGIVFPVPRDRSYARPRPQARSARCRKGGLHLAHVLRDRPVRLDGANDLRALPGAARPDAELGHIGFSCRPGWSSDS